MILFDVHRCFFNQNLPNVFHKDLNQKPQTTSTLVERFICRKFNLLACVRVLIDPQNQYQLIGLTSFDIQTPIAPLKQVGFYH